MIGIKNETAEAEEVWYRVRKTWADAATQKGAFHSLENAKRCADENEGYSVFDESGKVIYSNATFTPYGGASSFASRYLKGRGKSCTNIAVAKKISD